MTVQSEVVRATGICALCDSKFVNELVVRFPDSAMPGGWAYIEIRHVEAEPAQRKLRVVHESPATIRQPEELLVRVGLVGRRDSSGGRRT